jgi:hypothetical protein
MKNKRPKISPAAKLKAKQEACAKRLHARIAKRNAYVAHVVGRYLRLEAQREKKARLAAQMAASACPPSPSPDAGSDSGPDLGIEPRQSCAASSGESLCLLQNGTTEVGRREK